VPSDCTLAFVTLEPLLSIWNTASLDGCDAVSAKSAKRTPTSVLLACVPCTCSTASRSNATPVYSARALSSCCCHAVRFSVAGSAACDTDPDSSSSSWLIAVSAIPPRTYF